MGSARTDRLLSTTRALAALLVTALGASVVLSGQGNQLRLVSTAWPPFTDAAGQARFALDLVDAGLGRIGVSATTTIVEAAQFTRALLDGPYDGSGAAWKDPDRERLLLYSQPYLENRLILVGRRGSDVSAATLAALAGKKIAIVEGYAYGDAVDNAGPTFVRSRSEEDSLTQLLTGAVDYTLMDDLVVQFITSNHAKESQEKLQFGLNPLVTRPLHLAVRRTRPDAESIISRFNAQLRGMIADGTYHRLLHVQWIQADVDGDGRVEYVSEGDRPGSTEPRSAYALVSSGTSLAAPAPQPSSSGPQRFYVGGRLYDGWGSIPDRYKVDDTTGPNPTRSGATIFKFTF